MSMDLEEYFKTISENCSIVVEKQKTKSFEKIEDYLLALIKFKKIKRFFFNSVGSIEEKILKVLRTAQKICEISICCVLLDYGKIDITKKCFFDEIIDCSNEKEVNHYSLVHFSNNIIYITKSIKNNELFDFCQKGFKVVAIF